MIDAVVKDIPVILDANDFHSCWMNTAALALLKVTRETPDPPGGRIGRFPNGEPDGMLYETAMQQLVWPYKAASATDASRDEALENMMQAYLASGVTAAVDMGLDESGLETLCVRSTAQPADSPSGSPPTGSSQTPWISTPDWRS